MRETGLIIEAKRVKTLGTPGDFQPSEWLKARLVSSVFASTFRLPYIAFNVN